MKNKQPTDFQQNISYQIVLNAYLREQSQCWSKISLGNWQKEWLSELQNNIYFEPLQEALGAVHIKLENEQHEILVGIRYWSLTERHQFIFPVLSRGIDKESNNNQWRPLELSHFLSISMRDYNASRARDKSALANTSLNNGELDKLIYRCLQSQFNTQIFIQHRYKDIEALNSANPQSFICSEQALVIGHQLHPTAKSRDGFSSSELLNYSPESAGRFQLHYFSIADDYLHHDSAEKSSAKDIIKQELGRQLENENSVPKELANIFSDARYGLIPVHPWQAAHLRKQSQVQNLEQQGILRYWGPLGDNYQATTSIRAVYNEHSNYMYKLSLNVRITNSERVNKSWELDRVLETARMLQLPVAEEIKKSAPHFTIVKEPAYISIKIDNEVLDGFSCILRDNTDFKDQTKDISAITSLVQDHALGGKNRLYRIIEAIAEREERPLSAVAIDWFERYFEVSIESLMRLFVDWGLCFEPHGQNTLIEMTEGYPSHCFCRDGQGFFHREASHKDWCKIMPNKGEQTQSIFPEDLAKERLIYYPFINQLFSMVNAFGCQGLADEEQLLRLVMQRLRALRDQGCRYPFSLLEVLEQADKLPCKGNLLTQLHDMDELVGDISTQSVYVQLDNYIKTSLS